jgi:hypothetical protein
VTDAVENPVRIPLHRLSPRAGSILPLPTSIKAPLPLVRMVTSRSREVNGMLYEDSGYAHLRTTPGNMLLAFSIAGR